ncbi:27830_t:CDS:2, partial [Racocetra persica]
CQEAEEYNKTLPDKIKYPTYQSPETWHSKLINTKEITQLLQQKTEECHAGTTEELTLDNLNIQEEPEQTAQIQGSLEKLTDISEKEFSGNEREEIQKVTRKNFEKIFPKHYILITKNSEYTTRKGTRIDDVVFDEKNKTFLVFEYKSKKDKGHFEQAKGYSATLSEGIEQERLLREVERVTGKRLESRNIK